MVLLTQNGAENRRFENQTNHQSLLGALSIDGISELWNHADVPAT